MTSHESNPKWSRRRFLKSGVGLGAGAMALGFPSFTSLPPWLEAATHGAAPTDRRLVIIQLTGGNDGLNMVVPYRDDQYHRARPTLRIDEKQALPLSDTLALNPNMAALHELFHDGQLAVVNGVGYDNPDRSHFRSLDIWHSALLDPKARSTGWLGRAAEASDRSASEDLAWRVGGRDVPLALRGKRTQAPALTDASDLAWHSGSAAQSALSERLLETPRAPGGSLEAVRIATREAQRRSSELTARLLGAKGSSEYPNTDLGNQLSFSARAIAAGAAPPVLYLTQGGYDTHARQDATHGDLLAQLSSALGAFRRDLAGRGQWDNVLVFVFSEFGRRVQENRSRGTDHGAAAPVLLLSAGVVPGLHGSAPDLTKLVDGDLSHEVDFRRIYATLLDRWLGVDSGPVLGDFVPLPVIA